MTLLSFMHDTLHLVHRISWASIKHFMGVHGSPWQSMISCHGHSRTFNDARVKDAHELLIEQYLEIGGGISFVERVSVEFSHHCCFIGT